MTTIIVSQIDHKLEALKQREAFFGLSDTGVQQCHTPLMSNLSGSNAKFQVRLFRSHHPVVECLTGNLSK
jgi:hypothetical protein